MQKQNKRKVKVLKINFDMIEADKQFYLSHCNFSDIQERIFNYLTGKRRLSIIQIADKENISEATVNRHIRKIKLKMIKSILIS